MTAVRHAWQHVQCFYDPLATKFYIITSEKPERFFEGGIRALNNSLGNGNAAKVSLLARWFLGCQPKAPENRIFVANFAISSRLFQSLAQNFLFFAPETSRLPTTVLGSKCWDFVQLYLKLLILCKSKKRKNCRKNSPTCQSTLKYKRFNFNSLFPCCYI